MASIAEFHSMDLASEVSKGLNQKFETGGTPMRAPIGYLNVRKRDEQGRENRTVEIEAEHNAARAVGVRAVRNRRSHRCQPAHRGPPEAP